MLTICHAVPSLGEHSGGPSRSVSQLCEALFKRGVSITLVTSLFEKNPIIPLNPAFDLRTYTGYETGFWRKLQSSGLTGLLEELEGCSAISVIHQHGIWLRSSHEVASFASRSDLPLVVAPRGMLEPWALSHKQLKKKIAWILYQRRDLQRATAFHATALSEGESIRRLGFRQPIAVLPNGVVFPMLGKCRREGGCAKQEERRRIEVNDGRWERTVLFLSRINPKKGLLMLLEAWKALTPDRWRLVIDCNVDSQYLPVVARKVHDLRLGHVVDLVGPLFGVAKERAFLNADLFVLPSYSENFGIVVTEALAYGLPVITTSGTPWEELPAHGCGWWIDPTPEALTETLRQAMAMDPGALSAMGEKGRAYVRKFDWDTIAQRTIEVYRWVLHQGPKPDCVITD
jgi:glycosyltransferase involved in cell wall biosynthesis